MVIAYHFAEGVVPAVRRDMPVFADYLVVQRVQPYADSGHVIEVFKHFPHFGVKRIILHKTEPPCIYSV